MICEVCRRNQADIVFKTVTGNQVATKAVCLSCAHAMQQDMIKMFMSMGLHPGQPRQEQQEAEREQLPSMPRFICTNCGRAFDRLDENTMAGCPVCYEALRTELAHLFGRETPEGAGDESAEEPADPGSGETQNKEALLDLRFSLMEAVVREDFEEAARLRDLLAGQGSQGGKA